MGKKAMKIKKKKLPSNVAAGRNAKTKVFAGIKEKTQSGLRKSQLMKNKEGKVVTKKKSAQGKKAYHKNGLAKWNKACMQARRALGVKGFQAVGGKTAKGQALLKKTLSLFRK